jgi:hypothetical protein
MECSGQSGRTRKVDGNSEPIGGFCPGSTSTIVVGTWLTPERKARTELEVCVLNQNRGADEPLKITTADLARTLKANALMMVGDGDGFWVLTRN